MKNFFKKNWWLILGFALGFVLIMLGTLTPVCLIIGLVFVGACLIVISLRLRTRYKLLLEKQEAESNVFDATIYDYDEDVYIIGSKPKLQKQIKQGLISKLSAQGPSILFAMFGVGLIVLAITFLLKLIL